MADKKNVTKSKKYYTFYNFFLEISYTEKIKKVKVRCELITSSSEKCSKNVISKASTTAQNISGILGNFIHSYTIFMTNFGHKMFGRNYRQKRYGRFNG